MAATRPSSAPASVLDVVNALVTIVQFTESSTDVISLLQALPPSMLTPPLAALLALLTTADWLERGSLWPRACIGMRRDHHIDLLAAAMPIFLSAELQGVSRSERWPVYDVPGSDAPYCRFVTKWAAKIHDVTMMASDLQNDRAMYCNLLRACTNARRASLTYATDVLAAMTTPAHRVTFLQLTHETGCESIRVPDYPLDAAEHIQRWLASSHAQRLWFSNFNRVDAGLARVLASSTLSHLDLIASPGVVQGLVANGVAFRHLSEAILNVRSTPNDFSRLGPLLNLSKLQKLDLISLGNVDGAYLVSKLPDLVALEYLSLSSVDLSTAQTPAMGTTIVLRHASAMAMTYSLTSFRAMVNWALSSPQLESLTWTCCPSIKRIEGAADAMRRCVAAGVRRLSLTFCSLRNRSAKALAKGFAGYHAQERFELDLTGNKFAATGVGYLAWALTSCTNVRIHLFDYGNTAMYACAVQAAVDHPGVTLEEEPFRGVWLCSPMA